MLFSPLKFDKTSLRSVDLSFRSSNLNDLISLSPLTFPHLSKNLDPPLSLNANRNLKNPADFFKNKIKSSTKTFFILFFSDLNVFFTICSNVSVPFTQDFGVLL